MTMLRVLVVEDNLDIAANIGDFLEINGHQVDFAYDGQMAVSLVQSQTFDVIVMDIMMPKLDGIEATEQIRFLANGDIPILMLTAKDTLDEKLAGFASGADDYIIKPFDMTELYARIQAQARKTLKNYQHVLEIEGLVMDRQQKVASFNQIALVLNPTTFKILWQLAKASPQLVAKKEIEFMLWGDLRPEKDILRSHIYNLRKSLSKCAEQITVVGKHGQGYQLNIDNK